jgi:chemotaxis protein CheX
MIMLPTTDDLEGVTRDVWTSFLDADDDGLVSGGDGVADDRVTACVHLSGAFTGSVVVQCSDSAARDAAAVLFAVAPDDVTDHEVVDAIGEIANMVGGNVKSMLPGPSNLSLPAVAQVHLMWRTEPVVITLWEQA